MTRTLAVVLNYQREGMTAACVESLARSTEPVRVLIVDNASPDGSGARLEARFPEHAFLQTGQNAGYAGGNARGIAWALAQGAERIMVINDDAEVDAECVGRLNAALDADSRAAAASPMMLHFDPPGVVWWGGGHFDPWRVRGTQDDYGRHVDDVPRGAPRAVTFLCGCAVLFRAEALRALGAFREDFGSYVEDVELSVRYTRAGWRLLFVPDARIAHKVPYPESVPAPWKMVKRDQNRRRVAALHLGPMRRVVFWVGFAASRSLLAAASLMRGDLARVAALREGVFGRLEPPVKSRGLGPSA